ncbi:N6-adenosine-methyltransferase catalytic subunit-like [Cygnus olor]|uniref:N6-adenosine-methyltransferase catalytic subunit-like n=1 Tax=Cygnus olor TaxID=8869 RepID=UPI001ADE692D|nr:N6-adenosine-methyltransferase catalytic subunit-like [Cygnus olor]
MSDTWSSIQAHKKQLDSLRERLQRRRKQDPLAADPRHAAPPSPPLPAPLATGPPSPLRSRGGRGDLGDGGGSGAGGGCSPPGGGRTWPRPALERRLLLHLADLRCRCPPTPPPSAEPSPPPTRRPPAHGGEPPAEVRGAGADRGAPGAAGRRSHPGDLRRPLQAGRHDRRRAARRRRRRPGRGKRRAEHDPRGAGGAGGGGPGTAADAGKEAAKKSRKQASDVDLEIESLLSQQSTKEQQSKKVGEDGMGATNPKKLRRGLVAPKMAWWHLKVEVLP